jgi:hypothetical protein
MTGVLTAQSNLAGQLVEGVSDLTTVQAVTSTRGKEVRERATKNQVALPHVMGEDLSGGGVNRHPAGFSEFGAHNHQYPLVQIHILGPQVQGFADAESGDRKEAE